MSLGGETKNSKPFRSLSEYSPVIWEVMAVDIPNDAMGVLYG